MYFFRTGLRIGMVWLVEKKIFNHILDMGFERIEIPVRVKFEFEVAEGSFVSDSLTKDILYNHYAIEKLFPKIKRSSLDRAIEEMVEDEIMEYLRQCEFLPDKSPNE
jgi:hypothetical protein